MAAPWSAPRPRASTRSTAHAEHHGEVQQDCFVDLQFVSPDPVAGRPVNISSNATNVDAGSKTVGLTMLGPDAGTQGCP